MDYITVVIAIQVFSSCLLIHYDLFCDVHSNTTHHHAGGINAALYISATVAES